MEEMISNFVNVNLVVLFFYADYLFVQCVIDWIRRRER